MTTLAYNVPRRAAPFPGPHEADTYHGYTGDVEQKGAVCTGSGCQRREPDVIDNFFFFC